jgi:hypothetical protein
MYFPIGQSEVVADSRIIGIFDLDKAGYGKRAQEYLASVEREGAVLDLSDNLPKSFVVCDHPYHRQIVYLSQFSTATLQKRAETGMAEFS